MRMVFPKISASAQASRSCSVCGKVQKKTVSSYATINPFNNVSREEAHEQARESAQRNADHWSNQSWMCGKCTSTSVPEHQHEYLSPSELLTLEGAVSGYCAEYTRIVAALKAKFTPLIGRDFLLDDRIATITSVSPNNGDVIIGYRLYSRARYAPSGELLDEVYIRFPQLLRDIDYFIKPCQCGGRAILSEPSYADESAMVVCENCDKVSESFPMGEYRDGLNAAIEDWNS